MFWELVDKNGPIQPNMRTRCWVWLGGKSKEYGYFRHKGVHRISYELATKEKLKPQDVVCHKCDNNSCLRPTHLFKGTALDNMRDMIKKERNVNGELQWCSKLSDAEVDEVRRLYKSGLYSQRELARRFHCSQPNIGYIVRVESRRSKTNRRQKKK